MSKWFIDSAIKPQPVLSLGASLAACATVLGRKVANESGLRTNLYLLGVGESGCGKENARSRIKSLFYAAGCPHMVGDSFASDSGVEAAVKLSPSCLYLVDEIGFFFGALRGPNVPHYVSSIQPVLMTMFTNSGSVHIARTRAGSPTTARATATRCC